MDHPLKPKRDRSLLAMRLSALLGLAIAGYLLYLAWTGQTAPGCGEGEAGCNAVLSSRWSKLLGQPVSLFAIAAYLLILIFSINAGPSRPARQRESAWQLVGLAGYATGISAFWFIALQLFVLNGFCIYCMAAHACSLVIAGIAISRSRGKLPIIGIAPVAVMIVLQLFIAPPLPVIDGTGVRFGNFDPDNSPVLGDPGATHVMALLFDYNCAFCRESHRHAAAAVEQYDGQLVVILLPTALDSACNKHVQNPNPMSKTSCELARLALAVWLADRAQFSGVDTKYIEFAERYADANTPPADYVAQARAVAEQAVPSDKLDQALADPRIDEILEQSATIYSKATYQGQRGVPRLIIAGRAVPGLADRDTLFKLLEQAYPDLTDAPASVNGQ